MDDVVISIPWTISVRSVDSAATDDRDEENGMGFML